ncbi:tetratricopeptide repeat protein [Vreelandella stevensii]|uniref:tetratricopeptide repeat protein n=1 Tax=Vreelandella stevensii TaxID=502821 RepID=UPI00403ACE87
MRSITLTVLTGLTLTSFLPLAWALDNETQAAKDEGMRLYGISRPQTAISYLEQAAEAGDAEAMYYLGEANRRLVMGGMNQAALDWYYQAAQHGEPYAMLRLFDGGACELGNVCPDNGDDWPQAALELTLPKAEAGDPEAMSVLYDIYFYVEEPDEEKAMDWLMRAADAGHVESMNLLGKIARNDEESYANETERLEAAEPWFRQAAEAGHAPAMNNLASVLNHLDQPEEAWEWITKASEAGHINGRGWLAACNIEPDGEGMDLCRAASNPYPAKGWAILRAMNEEVLGTSSERLLRVYGESVTPEQREEGERMMNEWLNLEPPLSYFPEKFGP